jgi:lipopolysaccharide biosynthesis glycosyltransferase
MCFTNSTKNYAPYAGASVASLFYQQYPPGQICVYLMVEDVSRENMRNFMILRGSMDAMSFL